MTKKFEARPAKPPEQMRRTVQMIESVMTGARGVYGSSTTVELWSAVMTGARGVYVEEIAPPGEHWYKVVLSSGKVGIVHLPEELVDDGIMETLWRRLDAKDPVRALKII